MASTTLPRFADIQRSRAYGPAALIRPDERDHLLRYLREHGAAIATVEDVYHTVSTLDGEEELSAFLCQEGVAVSHASDGWWLLFRSGETLSFASTGVGTSDSVR